MQPEVQVNCSYKVEAYYQTYYHDMPITSVCMMFTYYISDLMIFICHLLSQPCFDCSSYVKSRCFIWISDPYFFANFVLLIRKFFNSGEVAKLFADAGLICVASLISPYRRDRDTCRSMLPDANFIEARHHEAILIFFISWSTWYLIEECIGRFSWTCP